MKVCRVSEMREMDKLASEKYGIPSAILMENAGLAVYEVIQKELGVNGKSFAVLCGPGNNGGDGFVAARKLFSSGGKVKVFILADMQKYHGDAKTNLEIIEKIPVETVEITSAHQLKDEIKQADAVIDALLGTGLDRNVDGLLCQAIDIVNSSGKKVFAVDIPSGINGNNGKEMGISIKADVTVTFGAPKIGNVLYPGYAREGKLYVSRISFPPSLYNSKAVKLEITAPVPLPERKADTNKMDYGPVLVISGAANYYWAPHASAYSFLKAGGGYAYLACPKSLAPSVARKGREIVIQPQKETAGGSIALVNKDSLLKLAERMKMVIIGPGMSLNEETQELIRILVKEIEKPLLIDGDGLTAIAGNTGIIAKRKEATILTPHIGEMTRITGMSKTEIENNRVDILRKTSEALNAHIVLKGPHSLIGCPDGSVFINSSGDTAGKAGMATAGSGDILNGTIAAMYCLGLDIEQATGTGVFIHGLSGDLAEIKKGADGMTAQDILNTLPHAVKYYRANPDRITENNIITTI